MKELRISKDLALPLDWVTLATVIYGARGSGKTSLGRVLAEEAHKAHLRFCAMDLKGDWWGLKSSADGKRDGIPIVVFGGDHQDVPLEEHAGAFVGETVAGLSQSVVLDLEHFSKGKQVRFLTEFFHALYDKNREPLLLLLDEAQRYAPQGRMPDPDSAKCLGAVEDLVKLGRKHGIGPVLFTQRGSGLNKEVSELCDLLVAFRTPGPLDQERVKDWLDANTTRAQRDEVMGALSGLATGTAVFASGHPELKIFGVYPVRRPETFDSSATPRVGQRPVEPARLAKPDMEAIRVKMAEAIERSKADDPKALCARVGELERELADVESLRVVQVPALTDEDRALLAKVDGHASALADLLSDIGDIRAKIERLSALRETKVPREPPRRPHPALEGPPKETLREKATRPMAASSTAISSRGTSSKLPVGELAILTAIAQHGAEGVTREQLSVLTGYKRSSRDTYLQRLRAAELWQPQGERLVATTAGVAELGPGFKRLPTGKALRDYWLARLPEGERRILEVVIQWHPRAVDRGSLDEIVGFYPPAYYGGSGTKFTGPLERMVRLLAGRQARFLSRRPAARFPGQAGRFWLG